MLPRILVFLFIIEACTRAEGASKTFPNILNMGDEFWQAEVLVTSQDMDATAFVTEYFDMAENKGRLDAIVYGEKLSIYYYNLTGDILEVNSVSCDASPQEQSDYFYTEMFHGWLYKYPLVIGPSALLWYAQDFKPDYISVKEVRGISCDYFELTVNDDVEKITYGFYFAAEDWTMPYQLKNHRIPIRISVQGESSRETGDKNSMVPVDQIIDYAYMRTIDDFSVFQPPIGLGCFGRSTEFVMPKISKEFRLSAEVYDLMKAETEVSTEALFIRLFFSNYTQLGRLDRYTSGYTRSDLFDLNNGVTYGIENGQSCTVKPMREAFFENYDGLNGLLKTPEEILQLIGDFYYMGEKQMRGIKCRVFESARRHVYMNYEEYYLVVTTVFFSSQTTKIATEGEDMIEVPIYLMLTAYKERNKVSVKNQYNIFGFDNVVGPTIFEDFPLTDCFPLPEQKSYFIINSPVDDIAIARTMEANNQLVVDMMKSRIMNATGISFIRLPYLKADYHPSGVDITGVMLDRPAAINQFWRMFYGPARADVTQVEANTKEKCANKCVIEKDFTCRGFHFCGGFCFLNEVDPDEDVPEVGKKDLGICEVFIRAIMTTKDEPFLQAALEKLSRASLSIDIPIKNETLQVKFPRIDISDGVFDRDVSDKSYNLVFHGMQLPAEEVSTTSKNLQEVTNENDCYRACKADTTIDCQSFSFCPGKPDVQCRISSLLSSQDMVIKPGILENTKGCMLYSLLNLDYYTPYPGKVSMITNIDSFEKVSVQECALKCKNKKEPACRGFDYCISGKTCLLHSKHVLDYQKGQLVNTNKKCTHYAAKYVADYYNMGFSLIDDDTNKRTEITLEDCARACSEEMPECKSFNYCPDTNEFAQDSSCALHKIRLGQAPKTTEKRPCRFYSKREDVESYRSKQTAKTVNDNYSSGGFAGVVIGTLIFGLIVGVAAFVGYSFYRSRKYNDGMSVRFMKGES